LYFALLRGAAACSGTAICGDDVSIAGDFNEEVLLLTCAKHACAVTPCDEG
jgi:hypothetical protein